MMKSIIEVAGTLRGAGDFPSRFAHIGESDCANRNAGDLGLPMLKVGEVIEDIGAKAPSRYRFWGGRSMRCRVSSS